EERQVEARDAPPRTVVVVIAVVAADGDLAAARGGPDADRLRGLRLAHRGRDAPVRLDAPDLEHDRVHVLVLHRVARRARGAYLGARAAQALAAEEAEDRTDLREIEDRAEVDVERIIAGAREHATLAVHERPDHRPRPVDE